LAFVLTAIVAASAAACSSSSSTPTPEQDKGLGGDDGAQSAPDVNPYGKPYPTDNIGQTPSTHSPTKVGQRGQKLANFKFLGYPNGDASQGLKPVSMANYYDPEGRQFKLIQIQAAGVWCVYCRQEAQLKQSISQKLRDEKVALITTIAEGVNTGQPAIQSDLDNWIGKFKPDYATLLDPGNKNLGGFYDAAALPWNAYIDARTMEILSASVGTAEQTSAQIQAKAESWLKFLDQHSAAVEP
jgi:hypothetical protein